LRADERFDSRSFSEGWCPGARTITNLSWEQDQKHQARQTTYPLSVLAFRAILKNYYHVAFKDKQ
jgi:hypothetical protein